MNSFTTLVCYFSDGSRVTFTKYEIDKSSTIRSAKTRNPLTKHVLDGYHKVSVYDDDGKQRLVSVARAMLSTFVGRPPADEHTVDHVNSDDKTNDTLENLRWANKARQRSNQTRSDSQNNAFMLVHDGRTMTIRQWAKETGLNESSILRRVRKNDEWKYEQYDDLPDETWKLVEGSKTPKGYWMVSDKSRAAYHTKFARKVYSSAELRKMMGYPALKINGKHERLHRVIFKTFRPEEFAAMRPGERILHRDDDKTNCDIRALRIGDASDNVRDAHDNGRYDGTKSQRRSVVAYDGDVIVARLSSLHDAERWLRLQNPRAVCGHIVGCLNGTRKTAYGYSWKES